MCDDTMSDQGLKILQLKHNPTMFLKHYLYLEIEKCFMYYYTIFVLYNIMTIS